MPTADQRREDMYRRIDRHGLRLLAIFPDAIVRDPIALCKRLRRLEARGHLAAERWCNGETTEAEYDTAADTVSDAVRHLLGRTNAEAIRLNSDPRGYFLKIDDEWLSSRPQYTIQRDWGGYGIIAPDLREAK